MLYNAIRGSKGGDQLTFRVIFLQSGGRHETVEYQAVCGPGDRREPVLTILLSDED